MKQLEHIIQNLGTDPIYAISVTNSYNGKQLGNNLTAALMAARFGSVEGYFNGLFTDGVKAIIIQPRRKNGSSWKDQGEPETIIMIPNDTPQPAQQAAPAYAPTLLPSTNSPEMFPGLNGGLNAAAIFSTMHYPTVVAENNLLKEKNEMLKEQVDKLKHEALEVKFDDKKAAGKSEMLTGLLEMVAPIAQAVIVGRMGGGGAATEVPGLGHPAGEGLSEPKNRLIQAIMAQDDYVSELFLATFHGMNSNEAFVTEFTALLQKYKLTLT